MQQVYSKRGAAEVLKISVETIDRYKKNGRLPYHQIGNRIIFTESDLTTFLELCAIPATVDPTPKEKEAMAKATGGVE